MTRWQRTKETWKEMTGVCSAIRKRHLHFGPEYLRIKIQVLGKGMIIAGHKAVLNHSNVNGLPKEGWSEG